MRPASIRLVDIQEAERRHLARELHDEIGQLLTGLRFVLRVDERLAAEALRNRLDQARELVDEILAGVRRVSTDLRPADLDQLGLLPALLSLFERFTGTTGIRVNFEHAEIGVRFAPPIETAAYRIVQEALTNVARHAGVTGVAVRVWSDGELLNLEVADSGRGFVPADALSISGGSGLLGMQERVLLLGGRICFQSAPRAGTVIAAELPLAGGAAIEM